MEKIIVDVELGDRGYPIYIGEHILEELDECLPEVVLDRKIFIIADKAVESYALAIQKRMANLGAIMSDVLLLPSGEKTKSFKNLVKIHDWLLDKAIHRKSLIVAIGGGVVGDLVGFAASTVLRGVPFLQIPTTLLSQVDSSVGGKTGINVPQGKNLIGSFYQPIAVIADVSTLKTLPKRQVLSGYAEIVKYGLLGDYDFFEWLEEYGDDVVALDPYALTTAIEKSCRAKAKIVQADEKEGGIRALLNLGHTFGHALETAAGFTKKLLHGEAVSIGSVMAFDLSVRLGVCEEDDLERVQKHFKSVGLPVDAKKIKTTVDDLMSTMRRDKKATDTKMTLVLVRAIGEAYVTQEVPEHLISDVLKDYL